MRKWTLCALAIAVSPWVAQAQEKDKASPYPHRLTGGELTAHFQETWSANGATSRANPVTIFSGSDGSFRIRQHTTSRTPDGFGSRKVDVEKNQVCLDITTTSWRGIAGCYRLVETEPKAYSLVRGNYRIDYRR